MSNNLDPDLGSKSVCKVYQQMTQQVGRELKVLNDLLVLSQDRCRGQASTCGQLSTFFRHKIMIVYLSISLNMCFGCSKEPSH